MGRPGAQVAATCPDPILLVPGCSLEFLPEQHPVTTRRSACTPDRASLEVEVGPGFQIRKFFSKLLALGLKTK